MKRPIKFRGKYTENGEWKFGYLNQVSGETAYIRHENQVWLVLSETVGQFTGLTDKNGVEIYEGDILAVPEFYETPEMTATRYFNHQVVFVYGAFHLAGKEVNVSEDDYNLFQESRNYDDRFEVVGNIHHNPELLS